MPATRNRKPTTRRTQPSTGVAVYLVYDRRGKARWVSVPKAK